MIKGMRIVRTAVLSLTVVCMAAFPAFADTVYVNASSLNLRSGPSTDSEILDVIARGTKLERESSRDGWSTVTVNGKKGYVSSEYLTQTAPAAAEAQTPASSPYVDRTWEVALDGDYPYASFAKISSGKAIYYHNGSSNRNGTAESKVTVALARILREKLLAAGYDVLMIREGSDIQLDNIARTVIANNNADCHIALHWDSTERDKGAFYMSVPSNKTYRAMEPVASHWKEHHALGDALIAGLKGAGVKIFSSGNMEMDLTQTSYSTIPSVDIELGDKISPHSDAALEKLADGLLSGVNRFFGL